MATFNSYNILATGGAIMLFFTTAKTGTVSLTRTNQVTAETVTLYSGTPPRTDGGQAVYLDAGDDFSISSINPSGTVLTKFLDSTQTYVYALTDSIGTTATDALQPAAGALIVTPDIVPTFMKILQAGLQKLALPTGITNAYVSFAPPEATFQQLPYIAIFPSRLDQADQPIGADVELVDENNVWTIYEQAKFEITLAMFFNNSHELLFFRDRALALMKFIRAEYFSPIGADSVHMYTSESYMEINQHQSKAPAFIRCDVRFQFKAENNCSIKRQWGFIEHIDAKVFDEVSGDLETEVVVNALNAGRPTNVLISMFSPPSPVIVTTPYLGIQTSDLSTRVLDCSTEYVDQHDFNNWANGLNSGGIYPVEPTNYNTYICWDRAASNNPVGAFNLATAAAGGYNAYYASMAHGMATSPSKIYTISLNNEFNLSNVWSWDYGSLNITGPGVNADNYVAATRHLVTAIKTAFISAGKSVPKIALKTNAGHGDPTLVYPGDDYIDILGMDLYAGIGYSGTSGSDCWNNALSGSGPYGGTAMSVSGITYQGWGLNAMAAFAALHTKAMGFDEWAWNWQDSGGMDMTYLKNFLGWVASNNVVYHSYWDSDSSAFSLNPLIATIYTSTYGPTQYAGMFFTHF